MHFTDQVWSGSRWVSKQRDDTRITYHRSKQNFGFPSRKINVSTFCKLNCLFRFFFSESAEIRWLSSEFHPLESVDFCSFLVPYLIFFVSWKESRACLEGSLHWSFSVFCWVRFTVWLWKWTPTYQQLCTLTNLNLFGRVLTFYAHSRF